MPGDLVFIPIGYVRSSVSETTDDVWDGVTARITLDPERFTADCLTGLGEFSHVEIVFAFHLVPDSAVQTGARHPRGRADWPRVGIFAQRAKGRPNRMGVTVCRIVSVGDLSIEVDGLDAVDGTPVLDIKPYMREFGPRGPVRQPAWATALMAQYWNKASAD